MWGMGTYREAHPSSMNWHWWSGETLCWRHIFFNLVWQQEEQGFKCARLFIKTTCVGGMCEIRTAVPCCMVSTMHQGQSNKRRMKKTREQAWIWKKFKAKVSNNELTAYSFEDPTMERNPCRLLSSWSLALCILSWLPSFFIITTAVLTHHQCLERCN